MKIATHLLFIYGAAGIALPAYPQGMSNAETATEDSQRIRTGEKAADKRSIRRGTLEEIIVTAQKREESLQEVPISISVLGGAELDAASVQGVSEALNQVPGVVATPDHHGGGSQIGIRGVAAGAPFQGGGSPVGYYLDSVPMSGTNGAQVPDANVFDLERVEVLRGPQGTLYGVNSVGGLVRVLTHDADLTKFDLKARMSASTTDGGGENYRGDAAINAPIIEGKLAARAVVGYQDLGGWIDTPSRKDVNGAELRTYRLKINARPVEEFSIGLSAWTSRQDYDGPSRSDSDGRLSYDTLEPMVAGYDIYGLNLGYEFDSFSVSNSTSYMDYQTDMQIGLDPFGLPDVPVIVRLSDRIFSNELLVRSNDAGSWRWSVGALLIEEKTTYFGNIPGFYENPIRHRGDSEGYAVFGQIGRRFMSNKFEWTLGARSTERRSSSEGVDTDNQPFPPIDDFKSASPTTPRAVLTWYPSNSVTLYGSYGEGFRGGGAPPAILPDLGPLQPDNLYNYELGVKVAVLGGRLYFDAAAYYTEWNDVQQFQSVRVGNVPYGLLRNIGDASGPGFDFSLTTRPMEGVNLGLTLSWNDLTLDDNVTSATGISFFKGDRLNYSSEYTGGIFAGYKFDLGGTGMRGAFSTSANHISKQSYNRIDGDALSIVKASFAIISADDQWTITLLGDNLTNESGGPPSQDLVDEWTTRMRPRSVGLQFEYHL